MECRTYKQLHVRVEFTGGLELLFCNRRIHDVVLPSIDKGNRPTTMESLIQHLCDNLSQNNRKDMFVVDGSIRPGILVLVNDADWELEGEVKYKLCDGDTILFVSTLHGG